MSGTVEGLAKEIVSLDVAKIPELSRDSPESSDYEKELDRALEYESDEYHDLEPEFFEDWDNFQNEWREYLESGHK